MRIELVSACLCAILSSLDAFAQEQALVFSQTIDVDGTSTIGSSSVLVLDAARETTIAAAASNADGVVIVSGLAPGTYTFVFSAAGFAPTERRVIVSEVNNVYNLGQIALEPIDETARLQTVTIVGQANQTVSIQPGVNAYSIENNALAQSGSTLDAMKTLPGVTLDQEGRVLLRGSDRVIILVDGKQSGLTGIGDQSGLESIPAANIARIEIINNPSAKYGAAGGAGVINLIMKEGAQDGWSGDVGLKIGVGALQKARADLPTDLGSFSNNRKLLPAFSLSHGGDKTDILLQGEVLFQDRLPNNEFTTRFYDDGRVILSQVPENREQTHYIFKAGLDHRYSERDTLSITAVYDFETHEDNAEVPFIDQATGLRNRFWFWTEQEDTGHASIAVDYTHAFDQAGHELNARIEYIRGWEDEEYFLNEESAIRPGGFGTDSFHLVAEENTIPISIDYVRPLSNGRFEVGSKLQFRWIPITYDTVPGQGSIIYPGLGDESEWRENIYSAYGTFVRETNNTVIEAGLRAEQTDVEYIIDETNIYYPTSDSYDYFELFPNVRLTYKLGENTDISTFYNRRVDRPGEPELRLFPKYDDPELLKVGNPYLRPQFTDAFEVSAKHAWANTTVSGALYFREIEDAFQRIFAIDPTNPNYDIVNKIFQNTGTATNTGIELIATHKQSDWMSLNGSVNIYEIDQDAATISLLFPIAREFQLPATSDTTWDAKLSGEFFLPAGIKFQLTGVYYAERSIPQGTEFARSSIDFGLSKTIRDDSIELSLTGTDLFNEFGLEQELAGEGFSALYQNYYETQIFMAGLKYKF